MTNSYRNFPAARTILQSSGARLLNQKGDYIYLYYEFQLEQDKQFKEPELADEWLSADETQQQEVKKLDKRLIEEARQIYSVRYQQGYNPGQQSNNRELPILVDLGQQSLVIYLESEYTEMLLRINRHQ